MRRKLTYKLLSGLLVLCMMMIVFVGSVAALPAAQYDIERISGADRYDTSAKVSAELFKSSEAVIIARGDPGGNYADALAASVLAGVLECPILLTLPASLPATIAAEIDRLGATKAYILGGILAVSADVEAQLVTMGLEVQRVFGGSRHDTAAEIAKVAASLGDIEDFAFIVNGTATADALVAGAYAYRHKVPILLVTRDTIPTATENALSDLNIADLYIVGGTGVVGEGVQALLDAAYNVLQRLAGGSRYDTSAVFAAAMFEGYDQFALVRGADANLADGISAAAFGLPILYVLHSNIPDSVKEYLEVHLTGFSKIYILGGYNAISDAVLELVQGIIEALPPMITMAYIVDDSGTRMVEAKIDNTLNTITLEISGDWMDVQFTNGYSNLSKEIFVTVEDTENGMYNIPDPGLRIQPGDDYVGIILLLFDDNDPPGVGVEKLLANSGAKITLTDVNNSGSSRTYTFNVVILTV